MKYLLKKDEQDKGVLCDKVTIDGFDYYQSDELIKSGEFFIGHRISDEQPYLACASPMKEAKGDKGKVIATTNPNIDLPQVVDEVEVLAEEHANKVWGIYIDDIDEDCNDTRGNNSISDFKAGYNKSQSTHPNSDEDMIEFNEWVNLNTNLTSINGEYLHNNVRHTTRDLLQHWKSLQPKVIYYHD